jgi:2-polyprenyl-6-methoxyphenol hydroxylase-like FAD-dependent oxidoreductase
LTQRYVAARVMIGYLPLGRIEADGAPLAAFFWSLKTAEHASWRERFAPWREEAAALWPEMRPVVEGFAGPGNLTLASYAHFTARRVGRLNLALAVDAAHATSPQLGQGANQGLIDAVVLADALARAPDIATALQSYAAVRRPHVRFNQRASALLTPFFQSDSRIFAMLRDLAFHRLCVVPYLRREMVRTLSGIKTGLFSATTADAIVNGLAKCDRAP